MGVVRHLHHLVQTSKQDLGWGVNFVKLIPKISFSSSLVFPSFLLLAYIFSYIMIPLKSFADSRVYKESNVLNKSGFP